MNINTNGQVDYWGQQILKILQEFGWNVEDLSQEILELREKLEAAEGEIEKLKS